jgi:hypothetical protein
MQKQQQQAQDASWKRHKQGWGCIILMQKSSWNQKSGWLCWLRRNRLSLSF